MKTGPPKRISITVLLAHPGWSVVYYYEDTEELFHEPVIGWVVDLRGDPDDHLDVITNTDPSRLRAPLATAEI